MQQEKGCVALTLPRNKFHGVIILCIPKNGSNRSNGGNMTNWLTKQQAEKIVDGIIYDLTDRRGLRQEWELIDDEIKEEIKECWVSVVLEE